MWGFGCGLVLGGGEQPRDLGMIEQARQRTPRARTGQGGRRIVCAQAFVDQKSVKLAQRRTLARQRRRGEIAPRRAQSCQIVTAGGCQIADMFARAFEIAAIGGQRVCRRTAFGGEHREEGFDRYRDYARATASAAIIRASGSSPTRRSAETM